MAVPVFPKKTQQPQKKNRYPKCRFPRKSNRSRDAISSHNNCLPYYTGCHTQSRPFSSEVARFAGQIENIELTNTFPLIFSPQSNLGRTINTACERISAKSFRIIEFGNWGSGEKRSAANPLWQHADASSVARARPSETSPRAWAGHKPGHAFMGVR
jgi:hypothetical protein